MRFSNAGIVTGWAWILGVLAFAALAPAPARAISELEYGLELHNIHRIEIEGNTTFSEKELKALLRIREPRSFHPQVILGLGDRTARYQPHLLEVELRGLSRFYRQRGFHQVVVELVSVVEDPEGRGDIIVINVVEGLRTYLDDVRFPGTEAEVPERLREELRYHVGVPAPADLNDLGTDIYQLQTYFWEHGHLEAEIRPEIVVAAEPLDNRLAAVLSYHIKPGGRYSVAMIDVQGNDRTRTDLIRGRLRLREGDLFRWSNVVESQRRLMETALFRDVGFIPARVDSAAGTADLLIQVVERRPAFFEFGFGVGSRERIRALAAWGHNNLFGTGQRLLLRSRNSLNYEDVQRLSDGAGDPELNYRYDITHTYPSVLKRYRLETNFYLEKETRGESGLNLDTRGFSLGTRFGFGRQTVQALTLRFERVDPSMHPDVTDSLRLHLEGNVIEESSTHSLAWDLLDERRDDPIRPSEGSLRTINVEIGGGPLGGDNSFWKMSAAFHGYTGFPLGGVLAFRVGAGAVGPYGDSLDRGADGVPYQERFFAGGVSSVRGYEERSLGPQISRDVADSLRVISDVPLPDRPARGGNYRLLTNIEWRFPVPLLKSWKVSGVAFVDGGTVWERLRDIHIKGFRWRSYPGEPDDTTSTKIWDYRWSFGGGLRVDTPVGPVRVDVGFPLKRARFDTETSTGVTYQTESRVIYHFSLGFPF